MKVRKDAAMDSMKVGKVLGGQKVNVIGQTEVKRLRKQANAQTEDDERSTKHVVDGVRKRNEAGLFSLPVHCFFCPCCFRMVPPYCQ